MTEPFDRPHATHWDLGLPMAVSTLAGAALSLSFPLLSLALEHAGHGKAAIGWSAAGHGVGMLFAAPFYAGLIARFGAIATMCAGLLVTAVVLLLLPLSIDPLSWFFARMAMGAAGAGVFIVTEAAVNAMVENRNRGRILGLYASVFCIGYAAGPSIVAVAGVTGWLPYLLSAGLFLLGIIPATQAKAAEAALARYPRGPAMRGIITAIRSAPLPFVAIFAFGFVEMGLFSLLPIFAIERGIAVGSAAFLLSLWVAGNVVWQVPIGWLSDVWSRKGMLLVVTALSIALIVPLFGLAVVNGAIVLSMVTMGGALGAIYTLSLTDLGERFRGSELTIANTAFIMALECGVMLGPPAGGAVMSLLGSDNLLTLWILALALLAAFVGLHRKSG